jgi:hypothetical protein
VKKELRQTKNFVEVEVKIRDEMYRTFACRSNQTPAGDAGSSSVPLISIT